MGLFSVEDAIELAQSKGLDVVEVNPNATPSVCKLCDVAKLQSEYRKKKKLIRKNTKSGKLKEIRLTPNINKNDLDVKLSQARKFLSKGNYLKISMKFKGRELVYVDKAKSIFVDIINSLSDLSTKIDEEIKLIGKYIIVKISPGKRN